MPLLLSGGTVLNLHATGLLHTGMTDSSPKTQPEQRLSAQAQAARDDRMARQAAALRANLRRRKEQARSRQDTDPGSDPIPPNGVSKTCP